MLPLALLLVIALLFAPAANARAAADAWRRPVNGSLLRAFALAPNRFAPGQHRGVDLAAALRSTVRAACGGRVTFTGTVPGGGRTVSVRCGRLVATYQHLDAINVRRGQMLAPGSQLGTVGRSGAPRTTRPHLHLGARVAATGRYVDPLSLLGEGPRTVPLVPPARAPQHRPLPLGPAPVAPGDASRVRAPQSIRAPVSQPVRAPAAWSASQHARAPARPPPTATTPWSVWIGLSCIGVALPLGGLVTVRRRARRRRAPAALARIAS